MILIKAIKDVALCCLRSILRQHTNTAKAGVYLHINAFL